MLEKRIIDGVSYFVNVIEHDDGSITEQYLDDYLASLEKKKDKETKEKLKKEKETLRLEKLKLQEEKVEFKKMQDDQKNNVDILDDDPNYLNYCTDEQKEGYYYLKNNNLKSSRKDLKNLLNSYRWRVEIYPSIRKTKEEKEKQIKDRIIEKQEFKKKLGLACLIIFIVVLFVLSIIGCSIDKS